MNVVKCYNSYIGLKPRLLLYVGYPILLAVVVFIELYVFKMPWMVTGIFCLTMPATLLFLFIIDRCFIGPVFYNRGQDDELIKSSPKGAAYLKNALTLDIIFRICLVFMLTLIIVVISVISGVFELYSAKIISSAVLFLLALDGVSNLMIVLCRQIDGINAAMIAIYGIEMVFIPAIAAVLIGKPFIMYVFAVVYLIIDIVFICLNVYKIKNLVKAEWYKDR